MKYRKKPIIVEAFRFGVDNMPEWFMLDERVMWGNKKEIVSPFQHEYKTLFCNIETPEGIMSGNYGDYIIKGVMGEIYICKAEAFVMSYEEVY